MVVELDVVQMWTHMAWVQGGNLFPLPVDYTLARAARYAISLHLHKGPLATHVLVVCQDPEGFFCKTTFQSVFPSLYWCTMLFCLKHNKFVSPDLHKGPVSPFLWLVNIPLKSSHACQHVDYLSQLNSICECDMMDAVPSLWSLVKALNKPAPVLTSEEYCS